MEAQTKLIERLKELVMNLNKIGEYLHANVENGKDEGFEEVMDVKLSRIKSLESEIASLDKQIAEGKEIPAGAEEWLNYKAFHDGFNDDYDNKHFEKFIDCCDYKRVVKLIPEWLEEYTQIKVKEALQSTPKQIEAEKGKELPTEIILRLSAGIYLKFHEKHNLSLVDAEEIVSFISEVQQYEQSLPKEPTPELRDELVSLLKYLTKEGYLSTNNLSCNNYLQRYLNSKEK